MHSEGSISIWFFIGVALVVNGALIFGSGIYELMNPPAYRVVLYQYHASIWWGALLTIFGLLYTVKYRPRPHAH